MSVSPSGHLDQKENPMCLLQPGTKSETLLATDTVRRHEPSKIKTWVEQWSQGETNELSLIPSLRLPEDVELCNTIMFDWFGDAPTNSTASWKAGPHERGTARLLYTCISTLVMCLYSSLHLNIPKAGKFAGWRLYAEKACWMVFGLLFPELVCADITIEISYVANSHVRLLILQSSSGGTPETLHGK
jgi:hypothetical protein